MHHRQFAALGAAVAVVVVPGSAAEAAPSPVSIVHDVTFDEIPDSFTSSLSGCESGEGVEGRFQSHGGRFQGVFNGEEVFTCADGEGGFTVQLNARFGEEGSTGTWTVIDSWGSQDGLRASGRLNGEPIPGGIRDTYVGTIRR
jgi:hypothetical protein